MSISRAAGLSVSLLSAALVASPLYCLSTPANAGSYCWGPGGRVDVYGPDGEVARTGYQFDGGCYYYEDNGMRDGGRGWREGGWGGPGRREPNDGADEQPTRDVTLKPCDGEGNPVVRLTGNKIEPELDFASLGELPLYLQRTYNHYWSGIGIFGKHWLSNFDYSLSASSDAQTLWIQYPDGRRIKFIYNATAARYNEDKPQAIAWAIKNPDGTYTLHNESHGLEIYRADGHIAELRNEQGIAWTFTYVGQYLQKVRHTSGREVLFTWTGTQLSQVTDPANNIYTYTYTANTFGAGRGRLASTTRPGAPVTTITYHYEDGRFPGGLTGKSFNNVRYSTIIYDAQARATSTEHSGGVEKYSLAYAVQTITMLPAPPAPPPPGGFFNEEEREWCEYRSGEGRICYEPQALPPSEPVPELSAKAQTSDAVTTALTAGGVEIPTRLTVTVTNPLGKKTEYLYVNNRLTSVTGVALLPNCPASYKLSTFDANGYPDVVADFEDGDIDYDFDAHGHLMKTVEASGKTEARTTTYTWDEAKNRLLTQTVAGYNATTYGYDTEGRIASVAVKNLSAKGVANQTRTTTYTYTQHPSGLVSKIVVDGPLGSDTVTSNYSATGDLTSVVNGLAHTASYGGHNGLGMPSYVIGPNSDRTDFAYDGRGRITTQKKTINSVVQTVTYAYDGAGNLASVQQPDGQKRVYVYDAAKRLTREYEQEAVGVFAQKRYAYNNLSQVTRVDTERTTTPIGAPTIGALPPNATGSYTVGWTGVADTTSYRLEEKVNSGAWTEIHNAAATSKAISGKNNATYGYRVRACNAAGCGPYSAVVNVVVSLSGPPAVPAMTAPPGFNYGGSYTAAWGSVPGATSYRLEESRNGNPYGEIYNGPFTSFSLNKSASATFSYRLRACNGSGCSTYSAVRSVVVEVEACPSCLVEPPPGEPTESGAIGKGGEQ